MKVLKIIGIVVLVLVIGFIALLIWAQSSGSQMQENFYKAVLSGDPAKVTTMMHPSLRKQVDEPVLALWMKAFKDTYGNFKGLSKTSFSTSVKTTSKGKLSESKGTVEFEKGNVQSSLKFIDDKLLAFDIDYKNFPDWHKIPDDTELYQKRGKEFLEYIYNDKPEKAEAMMHEGLKKIMPLEKLKIALKETFAKTGGLDSIEYEAEKVDPSSPKVLRIYYKTKCKNGPLLGSVKFEFVGFQGHILGFQTQDKLPD